MKALNGCHLILLSISRILARSRNSQNKRHTKCNWFTVVYQGLDFTCKSIYPNIYQHNSYMYCKAWSSCILGLPVLLGGIGHIYYNV